MTSLDENTFAALLIIEMPMNCIFNHIYGTFHNYLSFYIGDNDNNFVASYWLFVAFVVIFACSVRSTAHLTTRATLNNSLSKSHVIALCDYFRELSGTWNPAIRLVPERSRTWVQNYLSSQDRWWRTNTLLSFYRTTGEGMVKIQALELIGDSAISDSAIRLKHIAQVVSSMWIPRGLGYMW